MIPPELILSVVTIAGSMAGGYFGAIMALRVKQAILETTLAHLEAEVKLHRRRLHRLTSNMGHVNVKLDIDYDLEAL